MSYATSVTPFSDGDTLHHLFEVARSMGLNPPYNASRKQLTGAIRTRQPWPVTNTPTVIPDPPTSDEPPTKPLPPNNPNHQISLIQQLGQTRRIMWHHATCTCGYQSQGYVFRPDAERAGAYHAKYPDRRRSRS